jgi:sigma-B regulation protein RsbU (phosphoserine phosphatase)
LSEELLALLDDAPCGLMQTTPEGLFLRVNRTFCNWVGYAPDALVGQRRFQDLLTMGGRIFHQTHWAPLMEMQGSVCEVKLEVKHRDGDAIPIVFNAQQRERAGVRVHELAAYVARDRDKYERELVRSRARLEELVVDATRLQAEARDQALFAEQMIGIVSHDLRNPLSTIQVGTGLLRRGELTGNQGRVLGRIGRAAERANRLIGDLLDFTKARLGKGIAVSLDPLDLHEAIGETVEDLAMAYPGRRLQHVRSGAGEVHGDSNRLSQLVGNLVSNAMVHGGVEAPVTVTTTVDDLSFSISVHNKGAPIADELRATLFEPMVRGTNAALSGRSVGLGLFIVSEIARAHGGRALVHSTPELGTTFTAHFPRRMGPVGP